MDNKLDNKYKFKDSEALTTGLMDSLMQDIQIMQEEGTYTDVVMSQKAVTDALNKKINKTSITDSLGNSSTKVMSQYGVKCALDDLYYIHNIDRGFVHYCKGGHDGSVLRAFAENTPPYVKLGTTIIVRMDNDPFTPTAAGGAELKFSNIQAPIVLERNGGFRKFRYAEEDSTDDYICSKNIFLCGVDYEFYYDGKYWVLKNRIVKEGTGDNMQYRIWADGYVEQWGSFYMNIKNSPVQFCIPYSSMQYYVSLTGIYSGSMMFGNTPALMVQSRSLANMYLTSYAVDNTILWRACGY